MPPVLVILPGMDGTGKLHGAFREALGERVDCRTIPYPKDVPMGYAALTELVLRELPTAPFTLLAESFAGPLAVRVASRKPARLQALIFCASFAANPRPWLKWIKPLARRVPIKSLPRWLRAPLMWGSARPQRAPAQVDRAIAGVAAQVIQARIAAVLDADEAASLAEIRYPALVLEARHDLIVPRAATRALLKGLPQARLQLIDGPHLLLQSRPAQCAAAVQEFLHGLP